MHILRSSLLIAAIASVSGCAWLPDYLRPASVFTPLSRNEPQVESIQPRPSARHGRYLLAPSHAQQQVQVDTAYNWMPGEEYDRLGGFDVVAGAKSEPAAQAAADDAAQTLAYADNVSLKAIDSARLYFSTGSDELTAASLESLVKLPFGRYRVLGFADPRGAPARNLELSRKRAESVADWLRRNGYTATAVVACGAAKAAQDPQGFAQERRVDVLADPQGLGAGCPAP